MGTEFPSTDDISVILEISIQIIIMQAQSHYYCAETKFPRLPKYHLCLEIAAPVTSRICETFFIFGHVTVQKILIFDRDPFFALFLFLISVLVLTIFCNRNLPLTVVVNRFTVMLSICFHALLFMYLIIMTCVDRCLSTPIIL